MPDDPKKPPIGALAVDATSVASFAFDLEPGAMQGMRTEQAGFPDVIKEIFSNQAALGELAGVTASDLAELQKTNDQIDQIDVYLPPAEKLAEVLVETRAKLDDKRQRLVSAIAQSVESRAKASGNQELLARYEKTRGYRSAIGVKAAKTRRKNAQSAPGGDPPPKG